jgi:cytochrome c peroxidase
MKHVLAVLLLAACVLERPGVVTSDAWTAEELRLLGTLRLDTTLPPEPSNRWADDPLAAALGRSLFFDVMMSPSGVASCQSCHLPGLNFSDGKRVAVGVGLTTRNAPVIPGSQFSPWQFWDGRADSLWAQASGPIESPVEMGSDRTWIAHRVTTAHAEAYRAVFGEVPDLSDRTRFPERALPGPHPDSSLVAAWEQMATDDRRIVMEVYTRALKAISAFERTLLPTTSAFDRYVDATLAGEAGGGGHLSPQQEHGLKLFVRKGNCVTCHHGPMFTDRAFHNLGLPFSGPFDAGRGVGAQQVLSGEFNCRSEWSDAALCEELEYLDPSFPDFQQAFKTPTLRNVELSAPYMHHGELATLEEVVAFYDELPGGTAVNHRELTLQPLRLSEAERAALVAFLRSLTGPVSLTVPAAD